MRRFMQTIFVIISYSAMIVLRQSISNVDAVLNFLNGLNVLNYMTGRIP
jgi:hypothetical protein